MLLELLYTEEASERAETLIRWCAYLSALGKVVEALSVYEDAEILALRGDILGRLISELSDGVHDALERAYPIMNEFFSRDSLSEKVKRELNRIQKKGACPATLEDIDAMVQQIKPVLDDARNAGVLYEQLLKRREEMADALKGPKNKEVPGSRERKAGTSENAEQKLDGEGTVSETGDQVKVEVGSLNS